MPAFPTRELPEPLRPLYDLALDLRWTWSHEADALWERIDAAAWERVQDPWVILSDIAEERLQALAADPAFVADLARLAQARRDYLAASSWFAQTLGTGALKGVAYFSMEFGLGEALPLYAGGLGVLAGDFLKTASDLGLPVIGIGLLYQEGYFRQLIDAAGWQHEGYPFNDPGAMPIRPVVDPAGAWRHIDLDLPGRTLSLRLWEALIGRVRLYLLDTNDARNSPVDRGITGKLYDAGTETRLLQEIVLGVGGWRAVEALAPDVEICHLNEGHAAFVVFERARSAMRRLGLSFAEALWATRAGNVFTTHTPIAAAFDHFPAPLLDKYAHYIEHFLAETGVRLADLLALGRVRAEDDAEPFTMPYLAMRGCLETFGVSRRHGRVSRPIFQPLYPRWPQTEVPVGHVTNGVHVPSWDSEFADRVWTEACGKERWRGAPDDLASRICLLPDRELWSMRGLARQLLVREVRHRLQRQLAGRGASPPEVAAAALAFDPNVLTIGFARRFTAYKRTNLLLYDPPRLIRMLTDTARPVQLVLAGKAHPADLEGKAMIRDWIELAQSAELRSRVVFLEDYDIALAQQLVQGVDLWINTPRRGSEACGTSGMKLLVNGGLNLSVRDGWWEEAWQPEVGWAIDDAAAAPTDAEDAASLYAILETQIVPEFYARDAEGMPRRWLERIRQSMATLTPAYSSGRMAREYVERYYLPQAAELRRRLADGAAAARALAAWEARLRRGWAGVHIGEPAFASDADMWQVSVPVYLGDIAAADVAVELYVDSGEEAAPPPLRLACGGALTGTIGGYVYSGIAPAARPAADYTVRVIPCHEGARIPAELPLILWQK
jgi:glycogen phosphorylase